VGAAADSVEQQASAFGAHNELHDKATVLRMVALAAAHNAAGGGGGGGGGSQSIPSNPLRTPRSLKNTRVPRPLKLAPIPATKINALEVKRPAHLDTAKTKRQIRTANKKTLKVDKADKADKAATAVTADKAATAVTADKAVKAVNADKADKAVKADTADIVNNFLTKFNRQKFTIKKERL
jgi:hypothetical protein